MEQPKGRTELNQAEIAMIRQYRAQGYSFEQISRFMKRSASSIKRVVYNWSGKY